MRQHPCHLGTPVQFWFDPRSSHIHDTPFDTISRCTTAWGRVLAGCGALDAVPGRGSEFLPPACGSGTLCTPRVERDEQSVSKEVNAIDTRLDAKSFLAKLYSWSMANYMLKSWLPLIQESSPLSSPDSPLHPHLNAIMKMTRRYNFTLRVSQVVEMFLSKVGGSEEHFPFSGLQEFMEWSCPGAWLGGIKR
jgi:hypothetical protein